MDINREIITAMKLIFFQIFLGGMTGRFVGISSTSDYVDFVIEIADIVIAEFL